MISTPPENIRRLSIFELGLSFLNGDTEFYFRVLRHHQPNKYSRILPSWDKYSKTTSRIRPVGSYHALKGVAHRVDRVVVPVRIAGDEVSVPVALELI